MSQKVHSRDVVAFGLVALLVGCLAIAVAADGQVAVAKSSNAIDVACDATSIRFGEPQGPNPGDADGDPGPHPYYGAPFVVQGVIFRQGTLDPTCQANPSEGAYCGLLPDGSPEFPDQVIGRWYCRGWFVGEGGPGAGNVCLAGESLAEALREAGITPAHPTAPWPLEIWSVKTGAMR